MSSNKWLLCFGALLGLIGVAAGAFGAHALKNKLNQEMLAVFEVGVRYQMYHALAVLLTAYMGMLLSGWFFVGGTVVFSGSLYLLALTGVRLFGAITPFGGLILLLGWLCLFLSPFFSRAS